MKKRQVLILGSYAPSLVHFRGALIVAMIERGHSVTAAAPAIGRDTAAALEMLGATPVELPLVNASLNPFELLRSYRQLRRLLRLHRPDVLLSYTIKPVVVGALAGRAEGVPMIVSLITGVGYAFTGGRALKRRISRLAASVLYRMAFASSDRIIFQNPDDESLFRRLRLVKADQETRMVNGSGVDLEHFAVAPLPQGPSFLMIARLLKDKGIREFAQAAKRMKSEHPAVRVALVGRLDPSPDSISQQEVDELVACGIDFKGELADVRPAIADCSIYVLPSYREGTPRSVLEAMAMGRAVITTRAPGCRETVRHRENGLLVPPRDADALYQAMMCFVRRPHLIAPMARKSRRIAEEKYDVRQVNADLLHYTGL